MNVSHLVNQFTTTKIESNSVLVIGFLDNDNFIIKFNKTELHALSGTCSGYSSLYRMCLPFLIY